VAGGATAAYRAGGVAGVAEAAASAAVSPLRRAASGLGESYAAGARAATERPRPGDGPSGGASENNAPPAWAQRMRRSQAMSHGAAAASNALRSGDHPSGGHSIDLSEGE
ncbi:MAG: P-type conjugative transfer protein TrbL, partial [Rhizomicrobium sp.]